jgi:hypothetical protein
MQIHDNDEVAPQSPFFWIFQAEASRITHAHLHPSRYAKGASVAFVCLYPGPRASKVGRGAFILWVVSSGWWLLWGVLPGRASEGVFPFQDRAMKLRARL